MVWGLDLSLLAMLLAALLACSLLSLPLLGLVALGMARPHSRTRCVYLMQLRWAVGLQPLNVFLLCTHPSRKGKEWLCVVFHPIIGLEAAFQN